MFCCFPDPSLASLLAGDAEALPAGRDALLVAAALGAQVLALLALGAYPW